MIQSFELDKAIGIGETVHAIASRTISPVTLIEALIDRIDQFDCAISSFVTVFRDEAIAAGRAAQADLDAGRPLRPLHGVPFAVKDNFICSAAPTRANSRVPFNLMPMKTARSVERLVDAGAILIGKVNTYEYGTGDGSDLFELLEKPARNPWDLERFPGGSTTGGGAAVAAGFVPLVLGADTGGSVRLPAAACGVAGLKPTYDVVSREGVLPNCYSLDCVGPIAWTAADLRIIMETLSEKQLGKVRKPADALEWSSVRIGVIRRFHDEDTDADPEIVKGFEETVSLLRSLGACLEEVEPHYGLRAHRHCSRVINAAECYAIHEVEYQEHRDEMGPALRAKLDFGARLSAFDYLRAQRWRSQLAADIESLFTKCDIVVCAGSTILPPRLSNPDDVAAFTATSAMSAFSLSGHPAVAICNGYSSAGLPLNVQLVGRHYAEDNLLEVAAALENASGSRARKPDLRLICRNNPEPQFVPAPHRSDAMIEGSYASTINALPKRLPKTLEPFIQVELPAEGAIS